jgi:hypothetical protein
VNGDYAVWTRCDGACEVVRREITAAADTVLPEPATTTYQYGAAVTSTGVVYVARSGRGCGSGVRIVRYFGPSDPATGTVIASLGTGRDLWSAYARENSDGSVDVFYDRYGCRSNVGDIYRIRDQAPCQVEGVFISAAGWGRARLLDMESNSQKFNHRKRRHEPNGPARGLRPCIPY